MTDRAFVDYLLRWALQNALLVALVSTALLLVTGFLLGAWSKRRRSRSILFAFARSIKGEPDILRQSSRSGLVARTRSLGEPFEEFTLIHRAVSYLDPLDLADIMRKGAMDHLILRAALKQIPTAELFWRRGQIPGRALGVPDDPGLWVRHRLDIVDTEYVVRGTNTRAIEHTFLDLQNRFGAFLLKATVQAGLDPPFEVILRSGRLNVDELPALLHVLQGLARASQLR